MTTSTYHGTPVLPKQTFLTIERNIGTNGAIDYLQGECAMRAAYARDYHHGAYQVVAQREVAESYAAARRLLGIE
jgi:hypothetical protein